MSWRELYCLFWVFWCCVFAARAFDISIIGAVLVTMGIIYMVEFFKLRKS